MAPDQRTTQALARLTDSEKECLRRRLLPQTAKEMALDLGISPHAVEKRLKMARAKLGVSSSLEAARLLAAAEGYQSLVPRTSDLARPDVPGEAGAAAVPLSGMVAHSLPLQGLLMITILALLAFVAQDVPAADPSASPMFDERGQVVAARKVGAMRPTPTSARVSRSWTSTIPAISSRSKPASSNHATALATPLCRRHRHPARAIPPANASGWTCSITIATVASPARSIADI